MEEANEIRRQAQDAQRRVSRQELTEEMRRFQQRIQPVSIAINDLKVRNEALVKTLSEAGVIDSKEFERNRLGIRGVQGFLIRLSAQDLKMSEKIEQIIAFNMGQEPDFRVTDSYFSEGKQYLVANPDHLDIDTIVRYSQGLGISDKDIEEMFVQIKAVEELRAEHEQAAAGGTPANA